VPELVSKAIRYTTALGAVLFSLVGLSACGGIAGNDVVQIGGGSAISKDAFDHWMQVASSSGGATGEKTPVPDPPDYTACIAHLQATQAKPEKGQKAPTTAQLKSQCEQQYKSLQQEVLGFLISSSWVLAEANNLGVHVSDKEVHDQFLKIKAEQFPKAAEFEKFLSTSGQTVSDLLLRVKLNMLSQKIQEKIIKKKPTVTQAQVEKYYNENKSRYGSPEKRNINLILTKNEAEAKKAKQEIESGKSFASVAKAVSIDPTSKAKGGNLPEVVKGEESKELDEAVFSAQPHTLSGPVKTQFGYYLYQVNSITPGNQEPLSKVSPTIKQTLATQGQQQALSKFIKEFKKRWLAKTECRSGYVVADCKSYKAPKGTSTTGTSEGASGAAE
jgi:foldase protein PrsA